MSTIILAGGSGYAEPTGSWTGSGERYTNAGPATATYSFTGLTTGTPYVIALAWVEFSNRVTNAAWSVTGTSGSPSGTINQQNAPADFTSGGNHYQYFSQTFTPTGTTLTLTISYPGSATPPGNYVETVGAYVETYAATVLPTAQAGDWNTAATWRFNAVPTTQAVSLGHAITVTSNTSCGDGSNTTVLSCTGTGSSLTVTGADFTIKGNAAFGSGTTFATFLTVQNSGATPGRLYLDAATAPVVTFVEAAKLAFTGTSGAHCVINGKAGSGAAGRFVGSGSGRVLCGSASYVDFTNLGDGSNAGFGTVFLGDPTASMTFDHCTFDATRATPTITVVDGAATISLTNCTWSADTGALDANFVVACNSALTSGTRLIDRCKFLGRAGRLAIQDFTVTNCYFHEIPSTDGAAAPPALVQSCMFRKDADAIIGSIGNASNCYYLYAPSAGNGWGFFLFSGFDLSVTNSVCQYIAFNTVDLWFFGTTHSDPVSTRTATMTGNILLPAQGAAGGKCRFLDPISDVGAPSVTNQYIVEHNTICGTTGPAIYNSAIYSSKPGAIQSLKSNLVRNSGSPASDAQLFHFNADEPTFTTPVDVIKVTTGVSQADYNGWYGLTTASGNVGSVPLGSANGTVYFEPATAAPGTHDVTSTNPNFVDPTRDLKTWGQSVHGTDGSLSAALALIQADPTLTMSDLIPWVRAGFAPTNAAYHNTAHDGTDIGAVAYQAPATGHNSLLLLGVG